MSQIQSDTKNTQDFLSHPSLDSFWNGLKNIASDNSGYNFDTGKINERGGLYAADELLGGMNGANAARHAAGLAGDAAIAANAKATTLLNQKTQQDAALDRNASSSAAGIRATALAQSRGGFSLANTTPMAQGPGIRLGSDQQDFLGL